MDSQAFWVEFFIALIGCTIFGNIVLSIFTISRCRKKQIEIEEDKLSAARKTNELLDAIQKELHQHNELLEKKYSNTHSNRPNTKK